MIKLQGKISLKNLTGRLNVVPTTLEGLFQVKRVEPTYEEQAIIADEGFDALSKVIVGPKERPGFEVFATDEIAHGVTEVGWESSVSAGEPNLEKYYYNGVLLPEIPADVLAEYPYVCMYQWLSTGKIDILCAPSGYNWYLNSNTSIDVTKCTYVVYRYNADSEQWVYRTSYTDGGGFNITKGTVLWSTHDIPNGSATATEIYFESTPAVPEVALPKCGYNGHTLPAIPTELLELYPYAFIRKNETYCDLALSSIPYTYHEATETTTEGLQVNANGCTRNYRFENKYLEEIVYWPYRDSKTYTWTTPQNLLWSNYDILNETTKAVYFYGSKPT